MNSSFPAFLTRKSAALLENEELQKLLDLLEDNLSPPVEDRMINFEDYLKVCALMNTLRIFSDLFISCEFDELSLLIFVKRMFFLLCLVLIFN
jgi:hypothetical protein